MSSNKASSGDPDGDLTLVIGVDKTHFRISSSSLCLASPVFAVMLRPGFMEGQTLLSNGALTLTLAEDDPEALLYACHLLQNPHIERKPIRYTLLMKLAVLCDKYDLAYGLKSWIDVWINNSVMEAKCDENRIYPEMLWMTYVFDHHEAFYQFSRALLMSATSFIQAQEEAWTGGFLPERLLRK